MKILIVDDSEEGRLMLSDLLNNSGYETLQAKNGVEAIEVIRQQHPSMVISDIQMPQMDGFELCKQIKTDPELMDTAFIFYSSVFVEPEDKQLALDMGASEFIRKPAEPEDFTSIIESVIKRQCSGDLLVPFETVGSSRELDLRHQQRLNAKLEEQIQQLESTRRSLSTLISNLPGMVYRCRNESDWAMEFISDVCLAITGYPAESLIENRDMSYGDIIHKDDRNRVWAEVQVAVKAGKSFQIEYRLQRRDGSIAWVRDNGIETLHGRLEGYIADITESREAMVQRNRFFELSIDMLCVAGTDGYFKHLSPAWSRVLGWSTEEILARPWIELVHPDDRNRTEDARMTLVDGREIYAFTNRFKHKDGGFRWLSWNSMPLADEGLLYGVARDITERVEDERKLKQLNRALRTLSAGNRVLVRVDDEMELLREMCKVLVNEGGYQMAWAGFADHDELDSIEVVASAGIDEDMLDELNSTAKTNSEGQRPSIRAINNGATQIVKNIQGDLSISAEWRDFSEKEGLAAFITLPLVDRSKQPFGMLAIYSGEEDYFIPEEVNLLEEMANDLSYGIFAHRLQVDNLKSETLLEESLIQTIQAIALTVEKRDPYTAGHQHRVAELAVTIATEMGMTRAEIEGIRLGATIHDIGKIYVPAEILNRPGRLTEHEFGIIKTHPDVGYDIVKDIPFPWPIAEMVHQHHERMDGSGYPLGLKGDDILLEARIMAVADVVEAITSHRPYRPAHGIEVALEEIVKKRGIWFEPRAVDACLRLVEEGRFEFT